MTATYPKGEGTTIASASNNISNNSENSNGEFFIFNESDVIDYVNEQETEFVDVTGFSDTKSTIPPIRRYFYYLQFSIIQSHITHRPLFSSNHI